MSSSSIKFNDTGYTPPDFISNVYPSLPSFSNPSPSPPLQKIKLDPSPHFNLLGNINYAGDRKGERKRKIRNNLR